MKKINGLSEIRFHIALATTAGIISLAWLLSIPGDPKNAWLMSYSSSRAALLLSQTILNLLLIAATIMIWRKLDWGERLSQRFYKLRENENKQPLWVNLFILGLVAGLFLLSQVFYITDQQYLGYLTRSSPVIFFFAFISGQLLVWVLTSMDSQKRVYWIGSFFFSGGMVLLHALFSPKPTIQVPLVSIYLLIISTVFFAQLFCWLLYLLIGPFSQWLAVIFLLGLFTKMQYWVIPERYRSDLLLHAPLLITLLGFFGVLLHYLNIQFPRRSVAALLVILCFIVFGFVYYDNANIFAETVNTDASLSDQLGYLNIAQRAKETGFRYTGQRNQMPLYPFVQAVFLDPDENINTLFDQGNRSILCCPSYSWGSSFLFSGLISHCCKRHLLH